MQQQQATLRECSISAKAGHWLVRASQVTGATELAWSSSSNLCTSLQHPTDNLPQLDGSRRRYLRSLRTRTGSGTRTRLCGQIASLIRWPHFGQ